MVEGPRLHPTGRCPSQFGSFGFSGYFTGFLVSLRFTFTRGGWCGLCVFESIKVSERT
jgi:hypothetical protein